MKPHPFTVRQLQYVLAVAETLSFRKAAERCHVSQPALSAQIAQLEGALGVQLFERDRRRVLPTRAAAELLPRIHAAVIAADDLVLASRQAADPLAGTLRIGVIPTIAPYLLPSVAPALRAHFAALSLTWTENRTVSLVRGLAAGTLDAALLALEADLGDVEHEVVAVDPFVLATAPGDPLAAAGGPVALDALHDARVLLLDEGHCFREQALAVCAAADARELEFRATSLGTLAQMVAAGGAVTLLPQLAVETEAGRSGLTIRPLAEPAPFRTLVLAWRPRSPLAPALSRVAEVLRESYPVDAHRR